MEAVMGGKKRGKKHVEEQPVPAVPDYQPDIVEDSDDGSTETETDLLGEDESDN
jgi:hypothetical protein